MTKGIRKARLVRPSYFVWVIVPATIWLAYSTFGAPHFIWSYSWRDDGQGYDPTAYRYYTRCTYIGPTGPITEHYPANGKCGWVRFRKEAKS